MRIKVTRNRQIILPDSKSTALGAEPGSCPGLQQRGDGFLPKARAIDRSKLAPLRGMMGKRVGVFDSEKFREERQDPTLRD